LDINAPKQDHTTVNLTLRSPLSDTLFAVP